MYINEDGSDFEDEEEDPELAKLGIPKTQAEVDARHKETQPIREKRFNETVGYIDWAKKNNVDAVGKASLFWNGKVHRPEKRKVAGEEWDVFYFSDGDRDRTAKMPTFFYLHGQTGGNDFGDVGLVSLATETWFMEVMPKHMQVVVPRKPAVQMNWFAKGAVRNMLNFIVEDAVKNRNADPHRLYCGGVSQGAIGTYEVTTDSVQGAYPFAASVVISGGMIDLDKTIIRLADYPLWIFHGANDAVIEVEKADTAVASLLAAGANSGRSSSLRFTRFDWSPGDESGVGHAAFEQVWTEENIFSWMLQQHRYTNNAPAFWEVIPVEGVVVYEGQSEDSPQLPDRLPTGAVVEEMKKEKSRMYFVLLTQCSAPRVGWVNMYESGMKVFSRAKKP
eukprot:gnl/TRDRNA2_/TRDRNA2_185398_c0_seq1.p1 gnl/TRDRNA2_/TRDRNA2_185398_c0~~gnl/TRDRNA2_/TRDRNA2_185398_c0_seq1.p1  ORF type:complete len:411 (-),score=65.78 gnl/TRDRNA2_/TRDRNA2_185398_c0_seq1:71-1243(-)